MCRSETGDSDKPVQRCYKGLKSDTESTLSELQRRLNVEVNIVQRPSSSDVSVDDDSVVS